jgi:hypothetical protein
MAKMKSLIDEVLYEKYEEVSEENTEGSLKLFYDIDIFITRFDNKEKAAEGEEVPEEEPEGEEQAEGKIYKRKAKGEIPMSKDKAMNVLNLENLLNFASNMVEKGDPLINELVVETIKTAAGVGQGAIGEIFDEDDKMIVDLDYGFSKKDSIGVKITKTSGSEVVSFSMKKDDNILPSGFDYNTFNNQLLSIRKRLIEG